MIQLVLTKLRQAGFPAALAYPGAPYPRITETVAAVHIAKADWGSSTVTVEVSILSPESVGGGQCELEALRAAQALVEEGAVCVQNGCSYEAASQVYAVTILAAFTSAVQEEDGALGPGFQVYLEEELQPFVTAVQTEEMTGYEGQYVTGEALPAAVSRGTVGYSLRLEERIPAGTAEPAEGNTPFELRILREGKTEIYQNCCWSQIRREFSAEGLKRIKTGTAGSREG